MLSLLNIPGVCTIPGLTVFFLRDCTLHQHCVPCIVCPASAAISLPATHFTSMACHVLYALPALPYAYLPHITPALRAMYYMPTCHTLHQHCVPCIVCPSMCLPATHYTSIACHVLYALPALPYAYLPHITPASRATYCMPCQRCHYVRPTMYMIWCTLASYGCVGAYDRSTRYMRWCREATYGLWIPVLYLLDSGMIMVYEQRSHRLIDCFYFGIIPRLLSQVI